MSGTVLVNSDTKFKKWRTSALTSQKPTLIGSKDKWAITVGYDKFNRTSEHQTTKKRIHTINSIKRDEERRQKENDALLESDFLLLIQEEIAYWAQICTGTYYKGS